MNLPTEFDIEEILDLRADYVRWADIATLKGVWPKTLSRWRQRVNFVEPTIEVTNDELDNILREFFHANSRRGERMAIGHVRSFNFRVTRARIRASIERVDAVGKEERKMKRIERRVYAVAGPMHLWHVDGHHKLIKYGIVTMACIDGFSRYIPYINAVSNNRSTTALALFMHGTQKYGLPERVRGDRGGENVLIADHMIQNRGENRGSYLAGPSRFNTRIERLWRDAQSHTIKFYKDMFENLERDGMETDNNVHMYVLQHVFLPRINESLQLFRRGWNRHPIRTEHNYTPKQIMQLYKNIHPVPLFVDEDAYGAEGEEQAGDGDGDGDGPEPVQVNPILCPLEEQDVAEFQARCPPATMQHGSDILVNYYLEGLQVITEILNR